MTEVISRNEFDKSYLLIENKGLENSYIFKMLTRNRIPGIPECKTRYLDEKGYLAYDVTDKRTLERTFSDSKIVFSDLTELFYGIQKIMHAANDFLLDRRGFLLQPEFMFTDMETGELSCLYYPQEELGKSGERYRILSDFLLDRIDHKDEHAVTIAYHFYKISKEEYFSFDSFIGFMEKECLLVQAEKRKQECIPKEESMVKESSIFIIDKENPVDVNEAESNVSYRKEARCRFSFVRNIVDWYRDKKTEIYKEPEKPVRVEDYFDDLADDVTVFFDQDEYLTLKWKEGHFSKEYILEEFPVTVGKMRDSVQMKIEDISVSRLHARFRQQGNTVYLQDLDSTNGTYVNGKLLFAGEEKIIKKGDEIQFGKIKVNVV